MTSARAGRAGALAWSVAGRPLPGQAESGGDALVLVARWMGAGQ